MSFLRSSKKESSIVLHDFLLGVWVMLQCTYEKDKAYVTTT